MPEGIDSMSIMRTELAVNNSRDEMRSLVYERAEQSEDRHGISEYPNGPSAIHGEMTKPINVTQRQSG